MIDKIIVIISLGAMVFSMFMTAINWHLSKQTAKLVGEFIRAISETEMTAIKHVFEAANSVIEKLEKLKGQ